MSGFPVMLDSIDRKSLEPKRGSGFSVLLHGVEDPQDVQEEVDDVQVEVDGGQDVLLWGQLLHQQVGVVDDEAAEDQGPGAGQDQLCAVAVEEELQREQRVSI